MNPIRRRLLAVLVAAAAAAAPGGPAWAQGSFPSGPISMVVALPAGGRGGRRGAERRAEDGHRVRAPIIVENKPGAGGTLGAALVAKARPDGHTILLGGSATQIFGPVLYKKLQYDARRDFVPVGQISAGPLVLVAGSRCPRATCRTSSGT